MFGLVLIVAVIIVVSEVIIGQDPIIIPATSLTDSTFAYLVTTCYKLACLSLIDSWDLLLNSSTRTFSLILLVIDWKALVSADPPAIVAKHLFMTVVVLANFHFVIIWD